MNWNKFKQNRMAMYALYVFTSMFLCFTFPNELKDIEILLLAMILAELHYQDK
jgi:ABC-type microcin C transport system permease subunit YejE